MQTLLARQRILPAQQLVHALGELCAVLAPDIDDDMHLELVEGDAVINEELHLGQQRLDIRRVEALVGE